MINENREHQNKIEELLKINKLETHDIDLNNCEEPHINNDFDTSRNFLQASCNAKFSLIKKKEIEKVKPIFKAHPNKSVFEEVAEEKIVNNFKEEYYYIDEEILWTTNTKSFPLIKEGFNLIIKENSKIKHMMQEKFKLNIENLELKEFKIKLNIAKICPQISNFLDFIKVETSEGNLF